MPKQSVWTAVYTHLATLLILLIVVPGVCRLVGGYAYPKEHRGWGPKESQKPSVQEIEDVPGNFRSVTNRHFKDGFKRWGDPRANKKVLILGDSVVEMTYVSNGEEWYSFLEREFEDVSFFVYGGGAYGTLQEFMVLDDYLDIIRPDIIIWQFNRDDLRDNLYEAALTSYPMGRLGWRPFLEDGKIVYRMPMPYADLRSMLPIADHLLKIRDEGLRKKLVTNARYADEERASRRDAISRLTGKGLKATYDIFEMVKKRAAGTPVYLMSVQDPDPSYGSVIADKFGFKYIGDVDKHLTHKEKEEKSRLYTATIFPHWNLAGNRSAGDYLAARLRPEPFFAQSSAGYSER